MNIDTHYMIREKIDETPNFQVFSGEMKTTCEPVAITVFKAGKATESDKIRFMKEYEKIRDCVAGGVLHVIEAAPYGQGVALVTEPLDGKGLWQAIGTERSFSLQDVLSFAISLTETLGELHAHQVSHLAVTPWNVFVRRNLENAMLANFGVSDLLTRESEDIYNPEVIRRSMVYQSPEQTGRMNRGVDYRSDFYSLGVLLYEMLAGIPPIQSGDPMTVIHFHIALPPAPLKEVRKDIPDVISHIVMKLLAKNPEDRYQNAFGLAADLKRCRGELGKTGAVALFVLAEHDISQRFIIPQKLFGRDVEVNRLLELYESAAEKGNGITAVMVSGDPGIGKSSVISEIQKPVVARRGYFISGKYEQFRRDKPYSAVIQAFQGLVRQILCEPDEMIHQWRDSLCIALGDNAGLLAGLIPGLSLVIGEQPPAEPLGPEEIRHRFAYVFERFVATLCTREHPLALFLDDLQWADSASFHLIRTLLSSSSIGHLFLILSYRISGVDEDYPIFDLRREMVKRRIVHETMAITPLSPGDISLLVMNFLKCPEPQARKLSDLLHRKTGGNPFFINQILQTLYQEDLIRFTPGKGWSWDTDAIERTPVTDNLVDLMARKIKKLPQYTRDLLTVCACIGNRFDLETLARVKDSTVKAVLTGLDDALTQGLVNSIGQVYMFHHDRIQEAAYSLLSGRERSAIHYRIGSLILATTDSKILPEKLFYLTDQLNLGQSQITDSGEKLNLARLNLAAGRKARESAAFSTAYGYFSTGMSLLPESPWESHYELALDLYTDCAEAAYLIGDHARMDELSSVVMARAKTLAECIPVVISGVLSHFVNEDYDKAIDAALPVLKKLGMAIPRNPGKMAILTELLKTKRTFSGKSAEDLLNLPPMNDKTMIGVIRLMISLLPAAYYMDRKLLGVIILKAVRLSITYGNAPEHPFLYSSYGTILGMGAADYASALRYGDLALKLLKRMNTRVLESAVRCTYHTMIGCWTAPLKESVAPLSEASQTGLETGDLLYSSFNRLMSDAHRILSGHNMKDMARIMEQSHRFIEGINQSHSLTMQSIGWQQILNLTGESDDPMAIRGRAFDAEALLPEWIDSNNRAALSVYYYTKLSLAYQFHHYDEAVRFGELYRCHSEAQQGLIMDLYAHYFDTASRMMVYPSLPFLRKREFGIRIKLNLAKIKRWVSFCPPNGIHLIELLYALKAWKVENNPGKADMWFKASLDSSKKHGNIISYHFCLEFMIEFRLSLQDATGVKEQMNELITSLRACGWDAVVNDIMDRHKELVGNAVAPLFRTENRALSLDIETVTRSALAMAGEIDLKRLLNRIMEFSIENAGAQQGFLVMESEKDRQLYIEACGRVGEHREALASVPMKNNRDLPRSIVNYVFKTGENIVLADAAADNRFASDEYIRVTQPKSVLCAPIRHKGETAGILYLENNAVTDAFTPERLKLLQILSSQAAVAIDNARLFDSETRARAELQALNRDLEKRVGERTRELKEAYDQILSGIRYSGIIQNSLLPSPSDIEALLPGSFFLWRPRDIVGGDIFVCERAGSGIFIAVMDCTGHGVPGAFMTMLAGTSMRRIIREEHVLEPSAVLKRMNRIIKTSLQQDRKNPQTNDGLDAGVCYYDPSTRILSFAGANTPLYVAENGGFSVIKGDRQSIGYVSSDTDFDFTTHTIIDQGHGKTFYLATDGYCDQLGGEKNLRFGSRAFGELVRSHHGKPFEVQRVLFESAMDAHRAGRPQTDDITLLGFRLRL